jgi:hypothetical protein
MNSEADDVIHHGDFSRTPFSMTYSSETMEVVGKYTWPKVLPDLQSKHFGPAAWTHSSCGKTPPLGVRQNSESNFSWISRNKHQTSG